jgi:hypothetical protein
VYQLLTSNSVFVLKEKIVCGKKLKGNRMVWFWVSEGIRLGVIQVGRDGLNRDKSIDKTSNSMPTGSGFQPLSHILRSS